MSIPGGGKKKYARLLSLFSVWVFVEDWKIKIWYMTKILYPYIRYSG